MIKGDRIRLVRPIGIFANIGEECEVVNITEGGVICFRFGGIHLGYISFDEYERHFELVEQVEEQTKEWSPWIYCLVTVCDIDGCYRTENAEYRHDGKTIQIRMNVGEKYIRSECVCHADDKFSIDVGLKLARARLRKKYADYIADQFAKSL